MYRISKKMLKKGEIVDRGVYFYFFGYEYTFRIQSDDVFLQNFERWVLENMNKYTKHSLDLSDGTIIVTGFDYKFQFNRHRKDGENVMYHAFFSRWMENSYDVSEGNEMNQLLTGLEFMIVRTDPLAWVRDMWVPRNIVGHERSFEIWKTKYPEYRLTPDDIKAKGYRNGREFEEKYLADRLRGYGADVYGGSSVSPAGMAPSNPLVTKERNEAEQKMQVVREAEEQKKIEAAKPKICPSCGAEVKKGVRLCPQCGSKFELTMEEKRAEEVTKKEYPMFFIREADEGGEPYIYPYVNEELDPVPEMMDGTAYVYQLDGVTLSKKIEGQSGFSEVLNLISKDNYMYLTGSRLVVLNKKYNKNEAGSWTGFGTVGAMVIGDVLNATSRAVEAHKRKGKVFIGMLRYEWISIMRYHEKKGVFSYPTLEFYYEDLNKTTWCLTLYLQNNEGGAYAFADYLIHMLALHRDKMEGKKDEDMQKFIAKYTNTENHIPLPKEEGEFVRIDIPYYYYATKGKPFCPWYF